LRRNRRRRREGQEEWGIGRIAEECFNDMVDKERGRRGSRGKDKGRAYMHMDTRRQCLFKRRERAVGTAAATTTIRIKADCKTEDVRMKDKDKDGGEREVGVYRVYDTSSSSSSSSSKSIAKVQKMEIY